jgi:acetyl-CoA C-acetyltransferase
VFKREITPFEIKTRKGTEVVEKDEEYEAVNPDKIRSLRPAFQKENGTVTAANSSTFSDGASAVVLGNKDIATEFGSGPETMLARIVSYADAATHPIDFPLAPTLSIPLALKRAGLEQKDIALFEINEAFAAVSKAIEKVRPPAFRPISNLTHHRRSHSTPRK